MLLTTVLLVVAIILLTVLIVKKYNGDGSDDDSDVMPSSCGKMKRSKKQCKCPKCSSPEDDLQKEHSEYFTATNGVVNKMENETLCGDSDGIDYNVNKFGAPDMSYNDWAMSYAVDKQMIDNHASFVEDRLGSGDTGRTMSGELRGEMEGADLVPWMGIRGRPQRVEIHDPTQQVEFHENSYSTKPKLTWSST